MVRTKHKPPSRIRYEQTHPVVSVRVNRGLYQDLKEIKEREGKSFAGILKELLSEQEEVLSKQKAQITKAHNAGFKKGQRFTLGNCPECREPLHWDLGSKKDRDRLATIISQAPTYIHLKCLGE